MKCGNYHQKNMFNASSHIFTLISFIYMIIRFIVSRRHCSDAFARDCLVSYIANNNPPHIYIDVWPSPFVMLVAAAATIITGCEEENNNSIQANKIKEHERVIHVCVRVLNCARGRQLIDFIIILNTHARTVKNHLLHLNGGKIKRGSAREQHTLCLKCVQVRKRKNEIASRVYYNFLIIFADLQEVVVQQHKGIIIHLHMYHHGLFINRVRSYKCIFFKKTKIPDDCNLHASFGKYRTLWCALWSIIIIITLSIRHIENILRIKKNVFSTSRLIEIGSHNKLVIIWINTSRK